VRTFRADDYWTTNVAYITLGPLSVKTQSEKWFEEFCENVGLVCNRISEGDDKTPDYQLQLDGQFIIVEVKEFSRNKVEHKSDRLLEKRGYGEGISNTPGDRIRKKISDSSAQIKAKTQGVHQSILVLCDIKYGCGQITGHTDPYNIRVGMYGLEQVNIVVPADVSVSPYANGMSYGPKKKMTENQNTSISAIGVLSTPEKDDIKLDIYHNIYAANPLDPDLIAGYRIRQYCLENSELGTTAQWTEINL